MADTASVRNTAWTAGAQGGGPHARLDGPLVTLLRSTSLQLGTGIVLAVVAPSALRYTIDPSLWGSRSWWNTIIGTTAAILFGFALLHQMTRFPGIRATSYVMPCFTGAFGALLFVLFFGRIEYARSLFLAGYGVSLFWFFCATLYERLWSRQRYCVIPFGNLAHLSMINNADFIELTEPAGPSPQSDALIADFRADLPDEWVTFISDWVLQGRQAFHVKQVAETLTGRVDIEHLSENSFGSLDPGSAFRRAKLAVDWLVAAALLPPFALLTLIVGALIKLDSPGPVFFIQERVGYRGRLFRVVKFRTMAHADRTEAAGKDASMTRDEDPRITRVGKWLRKSRIDEIPQLLNILRAEMSWIGPRPEARVLSEWYEGELPFYRYRHIVRPGITGWAQINQGHVVEVDEVLGKLHYDFYYIKYFSPWLDTSIALRTVWVMMKGLGAR
ncbi:sugar transferase [Hansschlegelia plantiphila]|uniref:Glycosyl transferase n=1 Tax=Hansschlegelia plantiphila TaxID=374655 RepID=A0A9W6J4R4_9HYPH|nr:sugar transferase [Hansschlegelia plantiphila]GLK69723.1 glycosyl transferase [Hansschlegelia plantiphila]